MLLPTNRLWLQTGGQGPESAQQSGLEPVHFNIYGKTRDTQARHTQLTRVPAGHLGRFLSLLHVREFLV